MATEGITVVCKTLKEGTFELSSVETSITVGELKGLMTEARDNITDPKSLKLVFKGKILKDNDSLEKAGFTTKNNKVVVMKVKAKKKKAKPVEPSTVPAATSVTAPSPAPATNNNAAAPAAATENAALTMATENDSSTQNTDYTAQVAQLVALGVPESQALNALRMTQGNVEMAANLALGGGMGMAAAAQAQAQGNAPQGMPQGMPGMGGMGPMPSPAQIAQIAQNPQILEQLRNHPQIANNPQMQAIMNNPQMLQALLARFAQGGMQGMPGGMPGGMGGMQGMPQQQAAPAPVQIQLSDAEQAHVEQIVAIAAVPRERAVRAYMAGGKNVEHAINLLFSGALDD